MYTTTALVKDVPERSDLIQGRPRSLKSPILLNDRVMFALIPLHHPQSADWRTYNLDAC